MPFSQGITVSDISFPGKTVTLKGLNKLKNGVTIKSFDLPGNDPAGGVHLTLDTTIANVKLRADCLQQSFLLICITAFTSWHRSQQHRFPSLLWKYEYWSSRFDRYCHPGAVGHVVVEFDWPPYPSNSTIWAF